MCYSYIKYKSVRIMIFMNKSVKKFYEYKRSYDLDEYFKNRKYVKKRAHKRLRRQLLKRLRNNDINLI